MSPTAAFTSLPSFHVNKAFKPNSGCSKCKADAESTVNLFKQLLHHDESTCMCSDNVTIRDKSVHEAAKQHNAKNPPQHSKRKEELDYKRKSPHLAVIHSPNANSVIINPNPKVIQYNIHDPPHLTNNTEEDEEDNEDQSVT
eukprot:9985077-Ditylum_brightwellii.AAC.1